MDIRVPSVNTDQLKTWLEDNENILVLDVRPKEQREEWQIPGSVYLNAYQRLNENDMSVMNEISIPENTIVVTVCAAGKTSSIAASELRKKGIQAYSLEGGMKAWGTVWNKAEMNLGNGIELIQVRRTGKGCLSYIVASKGLALVIDPSLDIKSYESILKEKGLQLKFVFETHMHADHLSRAKMLAENNGAELYLPAESKVHFKFNPLNDGDLLILADINMRVMFTPGHTLESICFLMNKELLFTGDTLFVNGVGRPDLKADPETMTKKAKLLYQSLQKLLSLEDDIKILPAHINRPVAFDNHTIWESLGEIRKRLNLLQLNEIDFVVDLLERIPATPTNYLEIVEKNMDGDFSDIKPEDLEAGANRCGIA
jgi:glyoxylase-like metal-dependent hydrolase (beta-lactamase superfamily II)/rhodanese-related sulfurtransferase